MINAKASQSGPSRTRSQEPEAKQPTILLFGDSHSHAIQSAIGKRMRKGRNVPVVVHRLKKHKNGREIGDTSLEEFLGIIRNLDTSDAILSMIGGNQHAVFSLVQHTQPFDFFEPGQGDPIASGCQIIPYRILEGLFAYGLQKGDGASIAALRKATSAKVVHILPPPPKADNAFIEAHHESLFAKQGIAARGVSPASLRLKFWSLQAKILRDLCDKLGVEVMMPPRGTTDEAGFLLPDYYARDATHANHVYGELLLREVERVYRPKQAVG